MLKNVEKFHGHEHESILSTPIIGYEEKKAIMN